MSDHDRPVPDPEVVLRQTLRALAGEAGAPAPGSPAAAPPRPGDPPVRRPRGSDARWLTLVALLALLTGMVLGVGSLWIW